MALCNFAEKLTLNPGQVSETDFNKLQKIDWLRIANIEKPMRGGCAGRVRVKWIKG